MNFSRRSFIKFGGAAAFAWFAANDFARAQTVSSVGQTIPAEVLADSLFRQTATTFKRLVNSEFVIYAENSAATIVLQQVTEFQPPSAEKTLTKRARLAKSRLKNSAECFSLVFRGASGEFEQATYKLWHPSSGAFDLFLVPSAGETGEILLHAVINRI